MDAMGEAETLHVEGLHEGVDEADGVLQGAVVVDGFGEERQLASVDPFDVLHWPCPGGQGEKPALPYSRRTLSTVSRWS